MEWTDILFFLALVVFAVFTFYRAYKKKKWCPAVFGSDAEKEKEKKTDKSDK